jgi:uncharacterized protein YihD (DUF1040 family)
VTEIWDKDSNFDLINNLCRTLTKYLSNEGRKKIVMNKDIIMDLIIYNITIETDDDLEIIDTIMCEYDDFCFSQILFSPETPCLKVIDYMLVNQIKNYSITISKIKKEEEIKLLREFVGSSRFKKIIFDSIKSISPVIIEDYVEFLKNSFNIMCDHNIVNEYLVTYFDICGVSNNFRCSKIIYQSLIECGADIKLIDNIIKKKYPKIDPTFELFIANGFDIETMLAYCSKQN